MISRVFTTGIIVVTSFIANLAGAEGAIDKYPEYFQGKNGWVFAKQDYIDLQKIKDIKFFWYQIHFDMVKRITEGLEKRGITTVIVPIPHRTNVYPQTLPDDLYREYTVKEDTYSLTLKELDARNIKYVDVLSPLKNSSYYSKPEGVYYRLEPHWNAYGAILSAKTVAEKVKGLYNISKLPKIPFKIAFGILKTREDVFWRNNLPKGEQAKIKPDIEVPYTLSGKSATTSLLTDIVPAVTLIGTSFTGYGFISGLKSGLQTDVLDQSLPGKGMWTPMIEYLRSNNFKKSPPKIIVWEVPETILNNYPMPTDEDKVTLDLLFPSIK